MRCDERKWRRISYTEGKLSQLRWVKCWRGQVGQNYAPKLTLELRWEFHFWDSRNLRQISLANNLYLLKTSFNHSLDQLHFCNKLGVLALLKVFLQYGLQMLRYWFVYVLSENLCVNKCSIYPLGAYPNRNHHTSENIDWYYSLLERQEQDQVLDWVAISYSKSR